MKANLFLDRAAIVRIAIGKGSMGYLYELSVGKQDWESRTGKQDGKAGQTEMTLMQTRWSNAKDIGFS